MSAVIEEPLALEVVFVEAAESPDAISPELREKNRDEVLAMNRRAAAIESEALAAFMDLVYASDAQYIETEEYVAPSPAPLLDWDAVSQALSESQQILIGVQNLLGETLAAMGVEDYQHVRVYAAPEGDLRLVSDHPRREEIEMALNGPANGELRSLYHAAVSGMSLAGGLVGNMSVPDAVLEKVRARQFAA